MPDYILYTDGGARNNPGPAAIGYVLIHNNRIVVKHGEKIGQATNNIAEYQAMLTGLLKAKDLGIKKLVCRLDSQLVCEQLNQRYKIKDRDLGVYFVKIWNLLPAFEKVDFVYIPREQNLLADNLVNQALDGKI
ncbi:MAG: ribonuclease H [Candidatus Kerfeldbacteria bacterium CG08_land_8_20_14_0_20_43_14]|uniref:Ribonuclease H n=1 Tax=Candidatus Kerfeldbacteria bacterium CG08_land_8_20_14_0_20_43_14 TaxID=2014246 RepID=A0A2H0YPR9_9BACT|nr:MAG: ribonuclease H [Candidatus Kerfeldbacteria bacterium CG08_land_8_20_14_0_20_43_14]